MDFKKIVIATPVKFMGKAEIAPNTWSFRFKPQKDIAWKAGQHIIIFTRTKDGKRVRRAFSISSAPSEGEMVITTRIYDTPSAFKQTLMQLKRGQTLTVRGPIGRLVIDPESTTPYAFLATGIGITPFRAILTELAATQAKAKVTLFFAGNKNNHFFREELSAISAKMPNVTIKYIYHPDRLLGNTIEEQLGTETTDTIYFLSGSSKMVASYRRTLTGLNIPRKNIKSDTFLGLKPHNLTAK